MPVALVSFVLALLATAPSAGALRIDGHGWGHGAGMAQYGARGYAEREHRGFRWILAHYYRGTSIAARPAARIDVRLKEASVLRAQAVAARSYALAAPRPGGPFDVYADARSQLYRGVGAESSRTSAAVAATSHLAVTARGAVALTLFHSSSGGRTAAVEEVLASPPVPYLVSVADPYDRFSPYHDWSVTMSDPEAAQRLGPLVPGGVLTDRLTPGARPSRGQACLTAEMSSDMLTLSPTSTLPLPSA